MKEFEKILGQIDALNEPFSEVKLSNIDGQFQVIGKGGSSVVYDMTSKVNSNKHYAMKIIDVGRDFEALKKSKKIFKIQRMLSKKSKYIIELFEEKTLFITLDKKGNVKAISYRGGVATKTA